MEASELIIGNWVELKLNFEESEEVQCDLVDIDNIQKKNGVYQPIPLTEEWLVKFGFEKDENEQYYKGGYVIDVTADKKSFMFSIVINANGLFAAALGVYYHVHQLQNLYFALTGEELTIKE